MKKLTIALLICLGQGLINFSFAQYGSKSQTEILKEAVDMSNNGDFTNSNDRLLYLLDKKYSPDLICYNLATNFYSQQNYVKAEKYARQVLDMNAGYVLQAGVILGYCYDQKGKLDKELEVYENLSQKFPKEYLTYQLSGITLMQLKKFEQAQTKFQKSIALYSFDGLNHFQLSECFENQSRLTDACLAAYFGILTEPKSARSILQFNRIARYINNGETDIAVSKLTVDTTKLSRADNELITAMLYINDLKKIGIDNETNLPDAETFITDSRTLLQNICKTVVSRDNFTAGFYVNFFNDLITTDFLEEYLYYITSDIYPEAYKQFPGMTKERINAFADEMEKYFTENEYTDK